jgi:hypothetical protein
MAGEVRPRTLRYVVALLFVPLALRATHALELVLGPEAPFLLLWPVVMLVARYGGLGPGLLAQVASNLLNNAAKYGGRAGTFGWPRGSRAGRSSCGCGTRALASPRICFPATSTYSCGPTARRSGRRGAGHRPDAGEAVG